jgi:hypothetical protein
LRRNFGHGLAMSSGTSYSYDAVSPPRPPPSSLLQAKDAMAHATAAIHVNDLSRAV